jgi:serine/threonine protein kinase
MINEIFVSGENSTYTMQDETSAIKFERKYCPKCHGQFEQVDKCPDDGTELRGRDNDPLVGKVFAERYQIESLLGFGGMSVVYKAKHRLMDRTVAIKMLHANIKNDRVSLERFRLEAQAASSLNHQNIITVYDFGVTPQGDAFFVMDFLDGESLADLLERKGRLPWERSFSIFKQICDGLGAAHRKSIVHRDLKPANVVLIKDEGTEIVKLVDFGIAKLLPGSGKQQMQLTKTGEVFGSPIYMSPEQCLGKDLDNRSDLYALGCLMYETLTGEPPLLGETFLETLNKHVGEMPRAIAETVPDAKVPAELEQIIFKCMAKDPKDRFQSAEEIRDRLSVLSLSMTSTGAGRAAISGNMAKTSSQEEVCAAVKPVARSLAIWKIVAGVTAALSLSFLGFIAFWPGPIDDKGTPLSKLRWQVALANGQSAMQSNDFSNAERSLNEALSIAGGFGDGQARLEATLKAKSDLYAKWEGHAELLEKTNLEITKIEGSRLADDVKRQLETLAKLDSVPSNSPVALTNARLQAEAQVPTLLATAGRLYGRKSFIEQTNLLQKAVATEKKLLDENSPSLAKLESALADGLMAQSRYNEVRPLLVHVCQVREENKTSDPAEYLRALSRLGRFDLDQSNYKDAESELAKSVELSKGKDVDIELRLVCLRSYANMLTQVNRKPEAQKYLDEAAQLAKHATGLQ